MFLLLSVLLFLAPTVTPSRVSTAHYAGFNLLPQKFQSFDREIVTTVTIALKQNNLDQLTSMVDSVSNPHSAKYGQYLSLEEIAEIVAPPQDDINTVLQWIHSFDPISVEMYPTRDVVKVSLTVGSLERMFSVRMHAFQHNHGRVLLRSFHDIELPSHIASLIDIVHGVNDFPPAPRRKNKQAKLNPENQIKPDSPIDAQKGEALILIAAGGAENVLVNFIPSCLSAANGTYNSTTSTVLCSAQPPEVLNITLTAVTANDVAYAMYSTSDIECAMTGPYAVCSANIPVHDWEPVNLNITTYFNDSTSVTTVYPFPITPSPAVLPQQLAALYSIPQSYLITNPNVTQCVVEFESQYYSPSDLKNFFLEMGLPTDTPVTVIGPNYSDMPGGEADLDIQWIMAVAPGAPTTFWSIKANGTVEIDHILTWAYQVMNTTNPPLVHSLSYGMTEGNVDTYLGDGYLLRSEQEFKKLALRGITTVIACGDAGAGDVGPPPMSSGATCGPLHPDWPSNSPYVTAVGSTQITPLTEPLCYQSVENGGQSCDTNPLGEVVVSLDQGIFWTTGGGFSNLTSRPAYQDTFVEAYLSQNITFPPSNWFNSSGRAYPDVATVGHSLVVDYGGQFIPIDGTSASAPIFAGVITLLNDVRMKNGLPPMGFINPFLYEAASSTAGAFRDVVWGNNRCADWEPAPFFPYCCDYGFEAVQGWDAASGLGSPNFQILSQAALSYNSTLA